jgi:O-antigen/teichoic acid export membrane protein
VIPLAIQRITYPATSEYWSKQDYTSLNMMITKVLKYTSLLLVFAGLGVFFFSEGMMTTLFKKDFASSVIPLQVLLIGTVIRGCIAQPIGASLTGIGRPDLILKISGFIMITNVALNILLIPRIGITGAAIATTVSLVAGSLINFFLITKKLFIKVDGKWFLKLSGIAFVSIVLFWTGSHFMNKYLLGSLVLLCLLFIQFAVLLTKKERQEIWSLSCSFLHHR